MCISIKHTKKEKRQTEKYGKIVDLYSYRIALQIEIALEVTYDLRKERFNTVCSIIKVVTVRFSVLGILDSPLELVLWVVRSLS